jgi:hypothetical protein
METPWHENATYPDATGLGAWCPLPASSFSIHFCRQFRAMKYVLFTAWQLSQPASSKFRHLRMERGPTGKAMSVSELKIFGFFLPP